MQETYKKRSPLVERLLQQRPLCERCQTAPSFDAHEKKMRSAGGDILDEDNIFMLCRK